MKAFILVNIRTGDIENVVAHLKRVDGVTEAYMTFGPYDALAVIEAKAVEDLGRTLAKQIQPIPGVQETLTCIAVGS
ncbi:MAG: Lrp/AsnC ligand binding domain-containing protein [Anaerolineales bacterium]|jgi:DNA-binding Lrp family transcriptional regulator